MGTAKYDHPGYVADTGDAGKHHVGIWCPHGYPAHIHIGRPADGGDPLALLRLRIPDGVFQSLADDPETLCRRALGQRGAGAAHRGGVDGDYQEIRFGTRRRALGGPMQAARPDELPTAVVKSLGIAAACVNSDVITRAWRRRSISVRSGARSLFTTPMRQSQPPRARGAFVFPTP